MPDFRAIVSLDIVAEDKVSAAQLAKQITTNAKGKKHATQPATTKVYASDLIEVRER